MKKMKFFVFIIIVIGIISMPITSIGDVNQNNNIFNVAIKNDKDSGIQQKETEQELFVNNPEKILTFDFKAVEKYDKPLIYKIKYPVFNNKDIENKINSIIKDLANDFRNEFYQYEPTSNDEKFLFNLDTEIYILKGNILFIKFNIERNYNTYPNPVKFYETYIMDIKNEKFLDIDDILNKGYEDLFYNSVKEYFFNNYGINITKQSENYNDVKPDKEVYKKVFFKEDYIEVFFYDYKKQEEIFIKIPFEKVLPYIQSNYLDIETNTTTVLINTSVEKIETTTSTTESSIEKTEITTSITENITEKTEITEQTTKAENKSNKSTKRKIDKNKPMIALTFDDGPSNKTTNKILDILEKNNSVATFFVVSRRIEKDSEILKRMDSLECQIGNHTANHKDLTKLSKEQIKSEIDIVNNKLKKAIGKESSMVRVPYGATNDNVKQVIEYPIIMWNVDTKDWQSKNAKSIEKEVLGKVKDGDIILMHDLYDSTAQACEVVIPKLIEQGFQLVTVEELLEYKGIEVKNGVKYFNGNAK